MLRSDWNDREFEVKHDKRNSGCRGAQQLYRANVQKGISYISQHNDANVCVIGVESIGIGLSKEIVLQYIASAFDNEERNMLRLGKIRDFEDKSASL